jgi:hypothetical protein
MLSDTRHVKASDAEKESIREDIVKTRERLLKVRTYVSPIHLESPFLKPVP